MGTHLRLFWRSLFSLSQIFFWFDIFSVNQHKANVHESDWWRTTFCRNIEEIGEVSGRRTDYFSFTTRS